MCACWRTTCQCVHGRQLVAHWPLERRCDHAPYEDLLSTMDPLSVFPIQALRLGFDHTARLCCFRRLPLDASKACVQSPTTTCTASIPHSIPYVTVREQPPVVTTHYSDGATETEETAPMKRAGGPTAAVLRIWMQG